MTSKEVIFKWPDGPNIQVNINKANALCRQIRETHLKRIKIILPVRYLSYQELSNLQTSLQQRYLESLTINSTRNPNVAKIIRYARAHRLEIEHQSSKQHYQKKDDYSDSIAKSLTENHSVNEFGDDYIMLRLNHACNAAIQYHILRNYRVNQVTHFKSLAIFGDLVITSDLTIEDDLYVHGNIHLSNQGSLQVNGNLFTQGRVDICEGSLVVEKFVITDPVISQIRYCLLRNRYLQNGWQPSNHFLHSNAKKHTIENIFSMWQLDLSSQLSLMPLEILFLIFACL